MLSSICINYSKRFCLLLKCSLRIVFFQTNILKYYFIFLKLLTIQQKKYKNYLGVFI